MILQSVNRAILNKLLNYSFKIQSLKLFFQLQILNVILFLGINSLPYISSFKTESEL